MLRRKIAVPLLFLAAGLVACTGHKDTTTTPPDTTDPDSQTLADDGTDTSAAEGDAISLTGTFLSSAGGTVGLADVGAGSGDLSLDNVGGGARLFFLPLGCLTTENPTADSVRYTFNGCAGPRGLLKLTGVVDVTYASANGVLTLTLSSKGLQVNRATIDWNATAKVTASGANRTMDWSGHFTGVTRGGRQITRDNAKTVKWTVGDSCFEIDGTSEGTIGARDVKTQLISYKRCKGSCPESGSEIKITHVSAGKTVDLTYGTGEATFTNAKGDKITFVPLCAQ
jgi:hypothetical protein